MADDLEASLAWSASQFRDNVLFGLWGGYSNFVSDLNQIGLPDLDLDSLSSSLAGLGPIAGVEGAAVDLEEMSADAIAEALAEGRAFTSIVPNMAKGAAELNFNIGITSSEAEANLLSSGYSVVNTSSTGGNVLSNGTNFYGFWIRGSNGASGMGANAAGNYIKYNTTGP